MSDGNRKGICEICGDALYQGSGHLCIACGESTDRLRWIADRNPALIEQLCDIYRDFQELLEARPMVARTAGAGKGARS